MSMGYSETARDFGQYVLNTTDLIRNLAIDHVRPEIRRPWETYSKFCLIRSFPKLERAFLILDNTTTTIITTTAAASTISSTATATATITMGDDTPMGGMEEGGVEDEEAEEEEEDQIEFIDPTESKEEIMRLMENVSASFTHEVGVGVKARFESGGKEDDMGIVSQQQQHHFDCCLDHASRGGDEQQLALIPKTKVLHHYHHHHHHHHSPRQDQAPWHQSLSHTGSLVGCV